MGTLDAIAAVRSGFYTSFDIAIGVIELVEEKLAWADMPVEIHSGAHDDTLSALFDGDVGVETHLYAPKADLQADLDRAKALIDEARTLAIEVLKAIP